MFKYLIVVVIFVALYLSSGSSFLKDGLIQLAQKYFPAEIGLIVEVPKTFNEAKVIIKEIYKDNRKTFYCGCDYENKGATGGVVDHDSCGYKIRPNSNGEISDAVMARSLRIEYEHVFPASWYGQTLECWSNGGRKACAQDVNFNKMESNPINLVPAIGQVNGDRSNYQFGIVNKKEKQYGDCDIFIDFKNKTVTPPENVRGEIARIMLYMFDEYKINKEKYNYQVYVDWNNKYPITEWEIERNNRIKKKTGLFNPYVVVDESIVNDLTVDYQGELTNDGTNESTQNNKKPVEEVKKRELLRENVFGDRGRLIYFHKSCYTDESLNKTNLIVFVDEYDAVKYGYKLANGCK